MIQVELIRAWPSRSEAKRVELPDHACVGDALRESGWTLNAEFVGLGIFGVSATTATRLHEGDRVELLRRLQMDPKQARRLRAQRSVKSPNR